MRTLITFGIIAAVAAGAVVDRIAVIVGKSVITESEVLREVRLTEFLNGQPLDLGPAARRSAAERLVDQQLIRNEMEIGGYPEPEPAEADAMLRQFREQRYPRQTSLRAALEHYGLTEEELKRQFLWQLAVMRFTDLRFRPGIPGAPLQSANRMRAGAAPPANTVDEQMDAWLRQTREGTRIQFKKEAFE